MFTPLLTPSFTILAQSQSRNFFEIMARIFSRADTLAHPRELVSDLQALSIVWAIVFLAAGITCLLQGFRYYKTVTVILAAFLGLILGYALGKRINAEYIVAGCVAMLFAVGCFPLMKYSVAVMGGLVGSFLGANAWTAIAHLDKSSNGASMAQNYWVGALVGLIVCGMLAFILFKLSVVLFTSVSGATIAVMGGLSLLLQVPNWERPVNNSISAHAAVMPLLVMVPAVIGLILQNTKGMGGDAGKPSPKPA